MEERQLCREERVFSVYFQKRRVLLPWASFDGMSGSFAELKTNLLFFLDA